MRLLKTLPVLLVLLSPVVQADSYMGYFGVDASSIKVKNQIGEDLTPGNLRLRLGGNFAPYFDLEGHLSLTVNSDEQFQADWSADIAALFIKGHLPLGRYVSLYGLAGIASVVLTETIDRRHFEEDRGGFAYGVGLESVLTERMDISLDYVNYLPDDNIVDDVTALSFGFKFYF